VERKVTSQPLNSWLRRASDIQPSYLACFWADLRESATPSTCAAKHIASEFVEMGGFGGGTHKIDSTSGKSTEFALAQDSASQQKMAAWRARRHLRFFLFIAKNLSS